MMTWNIGLFIFCMIYNFSKCDGFTTLMKGGFLQVDLKLEIGTKNDKKEVLTNLYINLFNQLKNCLP